VSVFVGRERDFPEILYSGRDEKIWKKDRQVDPGSEVEGEAASGESRAWKTSESQMVIWGKKYRYFAIP